MLFVNIYDEVLIIFEQTVDKNHVHSFPKASLQIYLNLYGRNGHVYTVSYTRQKTS